MKAFPLTHVVYEENDILGFLAALLSLTPVFAVVAYVSIILARREISGFTMFCGQVFFNLPLNIILKKIIAQPRPLGSPGLHSSYGMPSDHTQFSFFLSCYAILWINNSSFGKFLIRQNKYFRIIFSCTLFLWASSVGWSRVYLSYHSNQQVVAGAVVGIISGIFWRIFVLSWIEPNVSHIFLPYLESITNGIFCFRDSTHVPSVCYLEAMMTSAFLQGRDAILNRGKEKRNYVGTTSSEFLYLCDENEYKVELKISFQKSNSKSKKS